MARPPRSDVGDADARVRLVAAVDRDQVRGQRLDLAAVPQPAAVHARACRGSRSRRRSPGRWRHGHRRARGRPGPWRPLPGRAAASPRRGGTRRRPCCPAAPAAACSAALPSGTLSANAPLESKPIGFTQSIDDLARQRPGQRGQQVPVALPGHGGNHEICLGGRLLIHCPAQQRAAAESGRRRRSAVRVPRADDDRDARRSTGAWPARGPDRRSRPARRLPGRTRRE